jgi:hypothetical protein
VTASGGARMQEGILSLMQLPKTVCAVEDLHDARCALINVFTHPTTAGVLASFASLGRRDHRRAGALISFTGPACRPADDRGRSCRTTSARRVEPAVRARRRHHPARELRPHIGRLLRLFGNG